MTKIMRNVYIEKRHQDWLRENPQFNLGGFIRKELDKRMKEKPKGGG